ncbi:MAG TPA: HEAT repeat domain-containing protein [Longimicrobium sp.]|nr:HEAT repeat domain-containing protein [Longimicrobium sp.]
MADAPAAARFVRAFAAAVLREGDAAAHASEARAVLDDVFAGQKSLVLDVQFTGFAQKGALLGGVDPLLLRAAGHLITLRVVRIGFTPATDAAELQAVADALARNSGELGEAGIVGAVSEIAPRGIYLSTNGGAVYKPAPRAPAEPAPAPPVQSAEAAAPAAEPVSVPTTEPASAEAPAAAGETPPVAALEPATPAPSSASPAWDDEVESTELAEFEILDTVFDAGPSAAAPAPAAPASSAATPAPGAGGREEPPSSDMYHFFRATGTGADEAAEALPRLLHEAENVTRFDELAEATARTALSLVRSDAHAQAVELLDALVREAERQDRNRFFRESAVQSLRRAGTPETLHRLVELLPFGGAERERILRFFVFMGADALVMLEGLLHRAPEPELRTAVFRALMGVEGQGDRLIAHAIQDPSPVKTRTLLELAGQAGTDPEVARRWAAEAAGHRDAAVRVEAARSAAALGGRGAMRVLVDLLGDAERLVRREAIHGLGTLGEAAAVPFLARLLGDSDEELQCMAAAALGRIGSQEALPPLLGVVNKRSLLQLKKTTRPKIAALNAIARLHTPAARDALQSVASGRDELAEEARRLLASL